MPFTVTDVFNAIVGYYVLVLAGSAAIGATRALRDPNPGALAAASLSPSAGTAAAGAPGSAPAAPTGRAARVTGLAHSRALHAVHRFGWATGVGIALGWLAGRDLYRWVTPRTASVIRRIKDRRTDGPATAGDAPDPAAITAPIPQGNTPAAPSTTTPDAVAPAATQPVDPTPPAVGPGSRWLDETPGDRYTPPGTTDPAPLAPPGALPGPQDPRRPGRPLLVLVPPPQEYPEIMSAAEITDLESLINFTGQVTDATGLEAEDAAAASASMIAGAEFAGETARRVAEETASLEAAVAAMTMLRVDAESTAAYNALLEAGQIYRDTTAAFSAQCHDAAATAGQMSAAAANYNETAQGALAVLNQHQMPHAEAASATGHSGAHGAFYGVADTGGHSALPSSSAPQLPAS